ncbi:MAG: TetR/AcrR family transcriptional regulator [Flavobacteriales bacterium]|nr:TetR/AcrR family transcriptional regulator [Flavobacteriales bacterium]
MISKSEQTKQYIIEKAAPIFNQKGYGDTSLSDICKITGLSKGSVYGNFKDKNELALESFNHIIRNSIFPLADKINSVNSAKVKMTVIFEYYKKYYQYTIKIGGCPILNVGIDANHQNVALNKKVIEVINKLIHSISEIIQLGQKQGDFNNEIDAFLYAKRIYSMIEGCIFTAMMRKDDGHIMEMMSYLEEMTQRELYK